VISRLSSDGKTLAFISSHDRVYGLEALDLATGQQLHLADNATEPSFSPNDEFIVYARSTGARAWPGFGRRTSQAQLGGGKRRIGRAELGPFAAVGANAQ
jgi:Tol biopolymer transport system component